MPAPNSTAFGRNSPVSSTAIPRPDLSDQGEVRRHMTAGPASGEEVAPPRVGHLLNTFPHRFDEPPSSTGRAIRHRPAWVLQKVDRPNDERCREHKSQLRKMQRKGDVLRCSAHGPLQVVYFSLRSPRDAAAGTGASSKMEAAGRLRRAFDSSSATQLRQGG